MKIAILGTGVVGRAHAEKLTELGHTVIMGTRDVKKTLAETKPDSMGTLPFGEWYKKHGKIKLSTFAEAAKEGELIIEAISGGIVVDVLKSLIDYLDDKILIDIANPLDFSKGMPPSLSVCNTDSLGERIQKAVPRVRVVKTLNATNYGIQVNPKSVADGDHTVFVSGNDAKAKTKVSELLRSYGWRDIIDLGDITTARGTEMLLPLWFRLWDATRDPMIGLKIVRSKSLV